GSSGLMFGVRAASCDERGGADAVSTAHPSANARGKTNSDAPDKMLFVACHFLVKLPGHVEPFVLMVFAFDVQQHSNRYWKRMLQYILVARPVYSLREMRAPRRP